MPTNEHRAGPLPSSRRWRGNADEIRSAKVLHKVAGRSMLAHVLACVTGADAQRVAVVIGPNREDVRGEVLKLCPDGDVFVQDQRLGTAHAVLAARDSIAEGVDDLLILFADTPLVTSATVLALRAALQEGATVAVLGSRRPIHSVTGA